MRTGRFVPENSSKQKGKGDGNCRRVCARASKWHLPKGGEDPAGGDRGAFFFGAEKMLSPPTETDFYTVSAEQRPHMRRQSNLALVGQLFSSALDVRRLQARWLRSSRICRRTVNAYPRIYVLLKSSGFDANCFQYFMGIMALPYTRPTSATALYWADHARSGARPQHKS